MKKIYTTLLLILGIQLAYAQNDRYDFELSSQAYVPLSAADSDSVDFEDDADWADFEELLDISVSFGFSVPILGFPSEGMINIFTPELLVSGVVDEGDDQIITFILPTTLQLQNRGSVAGNEPSKIFYQTTGEAGTQIFKFEYQDVGFSNESFEEPNVTQDMFTNIQVWIYEGSGCIEMRYGETSITDEELIFDGDPGSSAGLSRNLSNETVDSTLYAIVTTGDAQNPEIFEAENSDATISTATGFPAANVVYTFCPEIELNTTSLVNQLAMKVYPNPTMDFLTVNRYDSAITNYTLLAANGQRVLSGSLASDHPQIDVRDLPAGLYTLTIQNENGVATRRFLKR